MARTREGRAQAGADRVRTRVIPHSDLPIWIDEAPDPWLSSMRRFVAPHAPGEIELVQVRPWSLVLSARGPAGRLFFKATAPGGRHEPGLVAALAREFPALVPEPLATDPERGWLLLPDCGSKLRDARAGSDLHASWLDLLPRYAELQLATAREPERWFALGVPDRSPDRLPGLLAELVDGPIAPEAGLVGEERAALVAMLPEFEEACEALSAIPATLDHGDLHDGNVLMVGNAQHILDWGDACISCPFASLLVTMRGTEAPLARRFRDAYLEPWSVHAPLPSLREAFQRAQWVAYVGRALDWAWMLQGTGPEARREWLPRAADWLRGWAAREPVLE